MSKPEPDAAAPAVDAAAPSAEAEPTPEPAVPEQPKPVLEKRPVLEKAPAGEDAPAAEAAEPAEAEETAEPAESVEAEKSAEPAAEAPAPEPAQPFDPWAVPSGPTAAAPAFAHAGTVPPPGGGWASVPPGTVSGFQPGYPYPQAPGELNGFAIGALVTGLLCMWPVSLVLGVIGLVQIGKRNERGRGMAISGVVLGVLGAVFTALLAVGVLATELDERDRDASRDPFGNPPKGSVSWLSLKSGDCYDLPDGYDPDGSSDEQQIYWVVRAKCTEPHHAEVAGTVRIPTGDDWNYPGDSQLQRRAEELCGPVLSDYALDSWAIPDDMGEMYVYPSRKLWSKGERQVVCVWEDPYAKHKGSVRTDRSALTAPQLTYLEAVKGFNEAWSYEPEKDADVLPDSHRKWAAEMAAACRKEAEALSRASTPWPEEVQPKIGQFIAIQQASAAAWEAASKTTDTAALKREIRRAEITSAQSSRLAVEIRSGLGLSTGQQTAPSQV